MSSEWRSVTFGDVVDFSPNKKSVSAAVLGSYISTENMIPNFGGVGKATSLPASGSVSQFQVGDTLFSNIRTYFLKVWRAQFSGTCSPDVLVFRAKDPYQMYSGYLHHLCRWDVFTNYSVRTSKGAKMPRGDKNALAKFSFDLPSLDEQFAIAQILDRFDDQIILLREINETLEAIAQAIFKSWFVDFDPVKAKAAGLVPAGIDEATAALFPDSFVDSDSGSIPSGWSSKPIGDVASIVGGSTPDTKNPDLWEPAEFNWTSPKDLSGLQSPVLLDTDRKISAAGLAKISSGLLPAGTLLLSSRAPIGYLAISQIPIAINQGYIAMPPGAKLPPLYLYFWCKQNMEEIKARSNGSTFMEISKSAFRPIPAVLPPPKIIEAFMNVVGVLFEEIVAQQEEIKTLSELRDTLLPRLISGKLRIPETQEAVEEMA